jgi:hypothetical protein
MLHESTVLSRESIGIKRLPDANALARVSKWMALHDISELPVVRASRLSGGAIQENWRLEMADGSSLVLRTDADAAIPTSCTAAGWRLRTAHAWRVLRVSAAT